MAGTKIRGITIELGADTSGLSKALKGVNGEIKTTQKELKDVERLLKLDPGNVELLEQKQRLLGNQVEQTSKKLEALKEAQKQVGDELQKTGEGQEQYDALTREIAATERELKEAQKAAKGFNATTEKVKATASGLSTKFGALASKTRQLSQIAGGLLVTMGGLAIKAAQNADELNTLSKQTGISTAELQKMQYAADRIDVDTDTIVGGMKKLKKQLEATNSPLEKLGVKTKDAKGEFRDITDIFYDAVQALSEIPNETERDVMAMELFGKSADELAGIIDDGGQALRELGQEAENLGVIIPQDELDKANELNDVIDQFKAEASGTFASVGAEIAEMLLPYLPQIKEKIEEVLDAIREMDPEKLQLAAKVTAIIAILSPLLSVLSGLASSISTIASLGGKIAAFMTSVAGAVTIAVTAIAGFVAATGGAIYVLSENLDAAVAKIGWFREWVGGKFVELANFIVDNMVGLKNTAIGILSGFEGIIKGFASIIEGVFLMLASAVKGNWSAMWDGLLLSLAGFGDSAISILRGVANTVIGIINDIIAALNSLFSIDISRIPFLKNSSIVDEWKKLRNQTIVVDGAFAEGGTLSSGSAIVGEAGAEILTVSNGSATVTPLNGKGGDSGVVGLLETYLPYLAAGNTIVMDSGALVGSIAPDMNAALGTIAIRGGHR